MATRSPACRRPRPCLPALSPPIRWRWRNNRAMRRSSARACWPASRSAAEASSLDPYRDRRLREGARQPCIGAAAHALVSREVESEPGVAPVQRRRRQTIAADEPRAEPQRHGRRHGLVAKATHESDDVVAPAALNGDRRIVREREQFRFLPPEPQQTPNQRLFDRAGGAI